MTVTITVNTQPDADLLVTAVSGDAVAYRGDTIDVAATLRNRGDAAAGPFAARFYLSLNPVISTSDTPLGDAFDVTGLAAGASTNVSFTFAVPDLARAGYYIGLLVDTDDDVLEDNENNNSGASAATVSISGPPVDIADPDLAAAIRTALGLAPNTQLVTDDMDSLTELSGDSNRIDNLSGLELAHNLRSLTLSPTDFSVPGQLNDLSQLAGLDRLTSLSLVNAGVSAAELAALAPLAALRTLDVRYNGLSSVSFASNLAGLETLRLHGNPIADLSPLSGRPLHVDVAPVRLEQAQTIAAVADALHELPLDLYEFVLNEFAYQPYAGAMKGAQATLETRAGNAWDLAALLAELFAEAGVQTRFVSGRVVVPGETVADWLGTTSIVAARSALNVAGLNAGGSSQMEFDHAWIEANFPRAGNDNWVPFDPSWKFKEYRSGLPNLLGLVPFDETGTCAR